MEGKCRLCDKNADLQESHIIPSFVYRWFKDSSGTGYLRFGPEPNKRVQDGYKKYWLCVECEQRFQVWETKFANSVFHPFNDGETDNASYGPWLLKFAVSISWRVLSFIDEEQGLPHFTPELGSCAQKALKEWKEFLMDRKPHPGRYEQHLLPLDRIENFDYPDMPTNINRYILRTVDIDAVYGGNRAFVYSKLGRFLILGFVEMPHPRQWDGTKIHVRHGIIRPKTYTVPGKFGDYLVSKARRFGKLQDNVSNKQNKRIEETYMKDLQRAAESESFKAMEQDVRLFGRKAFKKHDG